MIPGNPFPVITTELNIITRSIALPCAQPAMVLAETAFKTTGTMILAALSIDPYSMLRGYVRPKDRRLLGRYRSKDEPRRGEGEDHKEHRFWKEGLPDTGREIGKRLPGASFFTGRRIGTAERVIWSGLDLGTHALWYYFMFELGKEGFMKWQSAVCCMQCPLKSPPYTYFTTETQANNVWSAFHTAVGVFPLPNGHAINVEQQGFVLDAPATGTFWFFGEYSNPGYTGSTSWWEYECSGEPNIVSTPYDKVGGKFEPVPGAPGFYFADSMSVLLMGSFKHAQNIFFNADGYIPAQYASASFTKNAGVAYTYDDEQTLIHLRPCDDNAARAKSIQWST